MIEDAATPARTPATLIDSPPPAAVIPKSRRGSPTPAAASPVTQPEPAETKVRQRARIVRTKDGLTYREMSFLRYYLDLTNARTRMNATQAGLAAGIARTPHAAHVEGSKLLRRPAVKAAIRKALAPAELEWQQVQRRLNALINADIGDVLWWDEESIHLRPFEDVPEEARWAIKKIRQVPTPTGPKLVVEMGDPLPAIALWIRLQELARDRGAGVHDQGIAPVSLRHLTEEQLELAMDYIRKLEEMGALPPQAPPA
jgi:hypothetical protein